MKSIEKQTLEFLSELKSNNNKEWFDRNRVRYERARKDYGSYVTAILEALSDFDPTIRGLGVQSCTYRINRDIRFTEDKTPYKTHLGAFIVKGGKRFGDRYAGYYIHVEPDGNSMIAGGAYMPPMPWLREIRGKIDTDGNRLIEIINDREFVDFYGSIEGEKLKGAPRGFTTDHPHIGLLRMKSFLVTRMIPDSTIISTEGFELVIKASRLMKPLNDFLNDYQAV
jgi:uncharacterized protein (TIGR02453 family)